MTSRARSVVESDHEREMRAIKLSVIVYVVVMGVKVGAYLVTGVMALFAEALHTLSDILVSGLLLLAARASRKRADDVHMFGYGRAQYVGALVAAILFVSFTSLELYREAIPKLWAREPSEFSHLSIAIGVLVLSMLAGLAPLVSLLRAKKRGAAAKAQLLELFNDQIGLLAALIGTIFVSFGMPLGDPIASIAVATIIAVNGVALFRENLSFLLGRSPGPEFVKRAESAARQVEGITGLHQLRAEQVGPDAVHVDLHVTVARGTPIERADAIAHQVMDGIDALSAGVDHITVHVDPEEARSATGTDASP